MLPYHNCLLSIYFFFITNKLEELGMEEDYFYKYI